MRTVAVLKSPDYARRESGTNMLPYRIDLLADNGYRVTWTDRNLRRPFRGGFVGTLITWSESLATPWLQATLTIGDRRRADVVLAMFESEGHGLALARRLLGARWNRAPLLVISCWLSELAVNARPRRRRVYRWLYGAVDHVVVLSTNQIPTLERELGIARDRVSAVHFGIDLDELEGLRCEDGASIVAIGRDQGRDWQTLASAVSGTGWSVVLVTRPEQLEGIEVPPEVDALGTVSRAGYLELLRTASIVVLPTSRREYPTGQTVLLEAMAIGKACVVTDTPAIREYVEDGVTAVLVPEGDPAALRRAIATLLGDPALRRTVGRHAQDRSRREGGAAAMWKDVAAVLDRLIDQSTSDRSH